MPLSSGTRLGPYDIVAPLGAGGMGEVYRAHDPRLGRDVAIKALPTAFAQDPERLARFEREAKLLASLSHPNIAGILGLEEAGGARYLVLELVEGETLAERLAHGPLPLADTFDLGRQVAAALEAAHERGVVHRDLKPGNIMFTASGEAKVLDFGLAKGGAGSASGSDPNLSASPTMTYAATQAGVILGTAAYMSPEQARGKSVDRRADIWSFGCVLFECLAGKKVFEGDTVSDLVARILEREPDWNQLPPKTPPRLVELLKRCLRKDTRERQRDAGDLRLELEWIRDAGSQAGVPGPVAMPRQSRERLAWIVAAVGVGLGLATPALVLRLRPAAPEQVVNRFSIAAPENVTYNSDTAMPAISPDGRTLAFVAADSGGTTRIWVRPFESLTPRPLAGTENASLPFWSPDSRDLAFFSGDGKLKRVPIAGGTAEVICDAGDGRGGSWGASGVIVFAPEAAGPLLRVPASGGEPTRATSLDSSRHEIGHRWPSFLPDGKHFLFVGLPARQGHFDVFVGSLDSEQRKHVVSASAQPVYAAPGYLILVRNASLLAQRFDWRRLALSGEPFSLGEAPPPSGYTGARTVTASENGTLAHMGAGLPNTELHWFDREGNAAGSIPVPAGRYEGVHLSPDGKRLCVTRRSSASAVDLWLVDLDRPVPTRFTFGPAKNDYQAWSHDGKNIAFASDRSGPEDIYLKPTSGAVEETPLLLAGALFKEPDSWSPDGRFVVFEEPNERTGWDLWMVPVEGDHRPVPYLRTPFNDRDGVVSPDGHWMAYYSDESGKQEVYVQSFPTPGSKYQVSTSGTNGQIAWVRGGQELTFISDDGFTIMAVDVTNGPTFRAGAPHKLFKLRQDYASMDITPDGQRILVAAPAGQGSASTITIEQNWAAGLKKP